MSGNRFPWCTLLGHPLSLMKNSRGPVTKADYCRSTYDLATRDVRIGMNEYPLVRYESFLVS